MLLRCLSIVSLYRSSEGLAAQASLERVQKFWSCEAHMAIKAKLFARPWSLGLSIHLSMNLPESCVSLYRHVYWHSCSWVTTARTQSGKENARSPGRKSWSNRRVTNVAHWTSSRLQMGYQNIYNRVDQPYHLSVEKYCDVFEVWNVEMFCRKDAININITFPAIPQLTWDAPGHPIGHVVSDVWDHHPGLMPWRRTMKTASRNLTKSNATNADHTSFWNTAMVSLDSSSRAGRLM